MERKSDLKIAIDSNTPQNSLTSSIINNARQSGIEIIDADEVSQISKSKTIFISGQRGFIRACPCSNTYRCCSYYTIDTIEGCIYECEYCILKTFLNQTHILVKTDIDALKEEIQRFYSAILHKNLILRVGTGELSDSLALEDIIPYAPFLIEEFKNKDNLILEFKTKSNKIENILRLPHNPRTVVSFSISTEYIQKTLECGTSSILERIMSAKLLTDYGYRVGFHFDPIIQYSDFQKGYSETIDLIAKEIPVDAISWISLGSLRFNRDLLDQMKSKILFSEYVPDMEIKLRYPITIRKQIYKALKDMLYEYFQDKIRIYLCMELDSLNEVIIGRRFQTDLELNNYIINKFI